MVVASSQPPLPSGARAGKRDQVRKPVYVSRSEVEYRLDEKLMNAAEIGDFKKVSELLAAGADVNFQNHKGCTPLHEATVAGSCVTLGVLLRAGADPNVPTKEEQRTPLHKACFHKFLDAAKLLLMFGANPFLKDVDGSRPGELGLEKTLQTHVEGEELLFSDEANKGAAEPTAENKSKLVEMQEKWAQVRADTAEKRLEIQQEEERIARETEAERTRIQEEKDKRKKEMEAENEKKRLEKKKEAEEKQREALEAARNYRGEDDDLHNMSLEDRMAEQQMRAEMQRRQQQRLRITGAGDPRVNGEYECNFFDTYRVEYRGVGDKNCNLYWSSLQNEWRLCVNDYKAGNTLYRNPKILKTKEVPLLGWLPWFGKTPVPEMESFTSDGNENGQLQPLAKEEESGTSSASMEVEGSTSPELVSDSCTTDAAASTEQDQSGECAKSTAKKEFLECQSILEICAKADHVEVLVGDGAASASSSSATNNLVSSESDTDGKQSKDDHVLQQQLDELLKFSDPIEKDADAGDDALWGKIEVCKKEGNEAYEAGRIKTALTAFTRALDGVGKMDYPDATRCKRMRGVLLSNRSLVLLKIISERLFDDERIVDVLYQQIKLDSTNALRSDGGNFKAYYRRAVACRNLQELDQALEDATRVLEHYSREGIQNPEAAKFREELVEEVKTERRKWKGGRNERWNRAEGREKSDEPAFVSDAVIVEAKAKKWTRPLVEKRLNRPGSDADSFLSTFCSAEEFRALYADGGKKISIPVEAFTALAVLLSKAKNLSGAEKKIFLESAERCVSSVGLAMLSEDEEAAVRAVKRECGL
eukprot:g8192.t1